MRSVVRSLQHERLWRSQEVRLEEETPDGTLLLFAISRGRAMKKSRDQEMQALLQVIAQPPKPGKPSGP